MTVHGAIVMGDAPTSVAIAVLAPPLGDRGYAPLLVLAARLLGGASTGGAWATKYDPILDPAVLLVSGPVRSGEAPDPGAARIRGEVSAVLERRLVPEDIEAARGRFGLFLGLHELDAAACRENPRALAVARARRAQLGVERLQLGQALAGMTAKDMVEAAALFAQSRAASVIAGGAIR